MKYVLVILSLFVCHACSAQITNPFKTIRYDSVVMYDFIPGGEGGPSDSVAWHEQEIKKRVLLNDTTVMVLNFMLGRPQSYVSTLKKCFDPHLGFAYYRKGKIVGDITVCLQCNQLYATPAIKNSWPGLSKSMRHFFNELLIRYGFSHSIAAAQE